MRDDTGKTMRLSRTTEGLHQRIAAIKKQHSAFMEDSKDANSKGVGTNYRAVRNAENIA